jgi:hypothetical protein
VCVTGSLVGEVLDLCTGLSSCSFPHAVIFLVRSRSSRCRPDFSRSSSFFFCFLVCAGVRAAGFSCFDLPQQFQCWFSFHCSRLDLSAQPGFRSALARGRSDLRRQIFSVSWSSWFPAPFVDYSSVLVSWIGPVCARRFSCRQGKIESCPARCRSVLRSGIMREQDFSVVSCLCDHVLACCNIC